MVAPCCPECRCHHGPRRDIDDVILLVLMAVAAICALVWP